MLKLLFGPNLVTKLDRLSTYAAALSYYLVLSLIPFLVITFTLGSMLAPKSVNLAGAYRDLLSDILPAETMPAENHLSNLTNLASFNSSPPVDKTEEIRQTKAAEATAVSLSSQILTTLQSTSHRGLATVGFILAFYTSYNLMEQIVRTLLFIFDDPRRAQRWNWRMMWKTVALLAIWSFLLLLISVVSVLTPVIQNILKQLHLTPHLWTTPLLIGRDIIVLAAMFGAFFLTFYLVPVKRFRMCQARDGALIASLGWVMVSFVFAYVLPGLWRSNAVYEALGSVVVILLWAQACAWSVIIGACWMVRFSPGTK